MEGTALFSVDTSVDRLEKSTSSVRICSRQRCQNITHEIQMSLSAALEAG